MREARQREWIFEEVETGKDADFLLQIDHVRAFPCHAEFMGADKWGVTSLRKLDRVPSTGAVLVVCPLPIVGGSGSPARVLALEKG
jgi:kynurenine formamidase